MDTQRSPDIFMNILDDTNPEMPTKYTTDQLKHSITLHCIDLDIKAQSIDTDVVDDWECWFALHVHPVNKGFE